MCKATIIEHLYNQIIKHSSGGYDNSIKDWNLKTIKLKTVALVTGALIGISIGKTPQNINIFSYSQYNLQQHIKLCLVFSYSYLPIDAIKNKLAGHHDLWM